MNQKQIQIPLSGYLRDWVVHQYGVPVQFPPRSYENAILARYLTKRAPLQPSVQDGVLIGLPQVRGKDAVCYCSISAIGIAALQDAIDVIFRLDMWHSLAPLLTQGNINVRIREWCISRGISDDHVEAVRQKFYRARKDYAKCGIILGKQYKTQD